MILSGGRSAQYHVKVAGPRARPPDASKNDALIIDGALQEFLTDCRSRLSARTVRTYESVIDLLRVRLNSYGYQYPSEADHDEFQAAYEARDEQAFCRLFGARSGRRPRVPTR